jgi:hypothetical protein
MIKSWLDEKNDLLLSELCDRLRETTGTSVSIITMHRALEKLGLRHKKKSKCQWQKSVDKLTPGRVAQAMGGVFAVIGTPTSAPKPRGKSPGWQPGKKRHRKNPCPIVKKTVSRPPKEPSVTV